MTDGKGKRKRANPQDYIPDPETVAKELGKAESMDDFFDKDGIFAKLFASTLEQMMEDVCSIKAIDEQPQELMDKPEYQSAKKTFLREMRLLAEEVAGISMEKLPLYVNEIKANYREMVRWRLKHGV